MERVGLIDLGSNTARLVIYDILDGGYFVVVDEIREAVRLGDTERDGNLKQTRVMQAISTLKSFKKICSVNNVDKMIAVATAAVRRAKNQKTFLAEVYNSTGIKVKVVSEEEEAKYVYEGVINSMEIPKGLIMEIGGGSTKFVYYNRRNILRTCILEFGAVNLTDMFVTDDVKPEVCAEKIEQFFKEKLDEIPWLKELDPDTQLIGVGGSFRNLARICRKVKKYPLDMVHNYVMQKDDFDYIYNMIKTLDLEQKRRIKGLSPARADVFPSALAAIKAFTDYIGVDHIVASGSGMREGIMFNYAVPTTLEKPISDVLGHSLRTTMAHLHLDEQHAEQTFNLCIQLFKQLRVLHKFPRAYVKVLRIASSLFDSGKVFKFYNSAKHTSYMILNSNLYGATHRDIVLAAFVVDVFDKEEVNYTEWANYNCILTEEDVEAVKKLAVILRLAISFDKSNANAIQEINCDVLG
ncbi:MAG: Ppx/GppA phosphatase family protein, partial [Clostridia bacterium]